MRGYKQFVVAAGLLAGAGAIMFLLIATKPEASPTPVAEREWVVDVVEARKGVVQPTLHLTGRIVAARDAELRPLAVGRIVEIGPNFFAGGQVRQGDLLVAIDPFDYENEEIDARAALAEAKASLAETKAELASNEALAKFDREQETLRKRDLNRKQNLTGKGVVSAKAKDDARIAYLSARETRVARVQSIARLKAQIERLEASVIRAEVRLRRAARNLADTRLLAPFDGVLVDVSATIGKRVGASDRIARIVDSERLEALFHVSDAQFGRLAAAGGVQGRPAEIIWRTGETAIRLRATLERVQGEFDAASGGVWVYAPIESDQSARGLRPGAFVEAETPDVQYANVVRLPEAAVHESRRAFVLADGRLSERSVTVLGRERGDLIVAGEIMDGDVVVTTRIPEIAPGLKAKRRAGGA